MFEPENNGANGAMGGGEFEQAAKQPAGGDRGPCTYTHSPWLCLGCGMGTVLVVKGSSLPKGKPFSPRFRQRENDMDW